MNGIRRSATRRRMWRGLTPRCSAKLVSLGTREASEAIRSGRMADINKALDELTKPEAQYFCTEGGTRTGYVVFDLADPSDRRATVPRAQRNGRVLSGHERRRPRSRTWKGVERLDVITRERQVVVASGGYQKPHRPFAAARPSSSPRRSPAGGARPEPELALFVRRWKCDLDLGAAGLGRVRGDAC